MVAISFVHHAARRDPCGLPSSLRGLQECLGVGARFVELDINPLADGDFALLHERFLDDETDGRGSVSAASAEGVRQLHLRWQGAVTAEPVGTLSEAVALAAASRTLVELQLDLKAHVLPTDAALESLARLVRPLGPRVRVTSTSDRAIGRLHALAPWLALGFDPLRHLDAEPGPGKTASRYLRRCGVYGYLDDHPLAADQWGAARDYLAMRAQLLWELAPVDAWCIRATLMARVLTDGFDWIAWLHRRGAQVIAWTLNPNQPHQLALAADLIERGVDRITTDDAEGLAAALGQDPIPGNSVPDVRL